MPEKRIKLYPSIRPVKKLMTKGGSATKRQSDYAFGIKDPKKDKRKSHDPEKELKKGMRGGASGGVGGGVGGGRWHKDPKTGRRVWIIM